MTTRGLIGQVGGLGTLCATLALGVPVGLFGQSRASQLIDSARAQVAAHHADSAAVLLQLVLDTAAHASRAEREDALVWDGITRYATGDDVGARAALRQALRLDPALDVKGLDGLEPETARLFRALVEQEKRVVGARTTSVWASADVDDLPRRLSAPPVEYPSTLLRRHVRGRVEVTAVIDTMGHAEPQTVEVLSAPDSAFIEPAKRMMLAARFSPGRVKGNVVRVLIGMVVDVHPPRLSATELVGEARHVLGAGRPDSAAGLVDLALDSTLTRPTSGEIAYALFVRGIVASRAGRDSAARADWADAQARYRALTTRHVDLAPFLRRLADSVRLARPASTARGPRMPAPIAIDAVDEAPVLLSHPTIHYPPEMEALRVEGIVLVEAMVDTSGQVEAGSAKIVETANHAFDAEAVRVVSGSVYRPARSKARRVRSLIRQAISFVGY